MFYQNFMYTAAGIPCRNQVRSSTWRIPRFHRADKSDCSTNRTNLRVPLSKRKKTDCRSSLSVQGTHRPVGLATYPSLLWLAASGPQEDPLYTSRRTPTCPTSRKGPNVSHAACVFLLAGVKSGHPAQVICTCTSLYMYHPNMMHVQRKRMKKTHSHTLTPASSS